MPRRSLGRHFSIFVCRASIGSTDSITFFFLLEVDDLCFVLPPKKCNDRFWTATEATLADIIVIRILNIEPLVSTCVADHFLIDFARQ